LIFFCPPKHDEKDDFRHSEQYVHRKQKKDVRSCIGLVDNDQDNNDNARQKNLAHDASEVYLSKFLGISNFGEQPKEKERSEKQ
jgi:hypothetical protein